MARRLRVFYTLAEVPFDGKKGPHVNDFSVRDGAAFSSFVSSAVYWEPDAFALATATVGTAPLGSPKWTLGQATSCPVCGITLAQAQMADHFQLEMDKLADFYSCRRWVDRTHEDNMPLVS
ncbi:hypothetical protein MRX96_053575 [Rhipicephalus microplus]